VIGLLKRVLTATTWAQSKALGFARVRGFFVAGFPNPANVMLTTVIRGGRESPSAGLFAARAPATAVPGHEEIPVRTLPLQIRRFNASGVVREREKTGIGDGQAGGHIQLDQLDARPE